MIDVVVLAAGASTRFGSDKLVADVGGRPLLAVTLDAVLECVDDAGCVVVVVDPGEGSQRRTIASERGVRIVTSEHAARGMRWSIHTGLDAVAAEATGAAITLADDPLAAIALVEVLARAKMVPSEIVAVKRNVPAPHPVYLPRAEWPAAPGDVDDRGLRALLDGSRVHWLDLPSAPSRDIDSPADLSRLGALSALDRLTYRNPIR